MWVPQSTLASQYFDAYGVRAAKRSSPEKARAQRGGSSMRAGNSQLGWFSSRHTGLRRATGLLLSVFWTCSAGAPSARAADWPRLQDGRAVIEMNGVRLALSASGEHLKDVYFNVGLKGRSMTLQEVLQAPDRAREAFAGKKNSVGFAGNNSTGLFLERFPALEYQGFGFAIITGPNSQGICQTIKRQVTESRSQIADGKLTVDADGFAAVTLSGKFPDTLYVVEDPARTASPRIGHLQCDALSTCGASICVGPNVSFDFHFPEKMYHRAVWQDVLRRASDVLNFVLIDSATDAGGK